MKVRLVFETTIEDMDSPTQYDILQTTVRKLQTDIDGSDSMDDLANVFKKMTVNGSLKHPGFGGKDDRVVPE